MIIIYKKGVIKLKIIVLPTQTNSKRTTTPQGGCGFKGHCRALNLIN